MNSEDLCMYIKHMHKFSIMTTKYKNIWSMKSRWALTEEPHNFTYTIYIAYQCPFPNDTNNLNYSHWGSMPFLTSI